MNQSPTEVEKARGLHRFAVLTAGATFCLIFIGGLVTSTGSALAVPDWPLAFGKLIPAWQGGIRFDRNLNPRLFAFAGADFMANALQFLDLRAVYTGGFGFHAIKSDNTILNILGGVNYTHETYSNGPVIVGSVPRAFASYGKTNKFVALTLGEEVNHKIGKGTVITQNMYFYPDLQDTSQYRWTFNFGSVTKISKWLGWQNQFGDIYVTNPPTSAKKNDVVFTTGLNIAFKNSTAE